MKRTQSHLDQTKNRTDIAELVRGYVALTPAGINMKGGCPFTPDDTQKFFVSPSRQEWRCFGCNKSGDAISFLQEKDSLSFTEAYEVLTGRIGA